MTNIHTHIFTMDHIPLVQLFYMVKDIIIGLLKKLPFQIAIGDIEKKKHITFLSLIAPFLSPCFQGALDSMVAFFSDVSDIQASDLRRHPDLKELFNRRGKLTLRLLVRHMRRRMRGGANFEQILIDLVTILYQINNTKQGKSQDQTSVLARLLASIKNDSPYERLVVLSIDFDKAFEHVYNPGFGDQTTIGFDYRLPQIKFSPLNPMPPGMTQTSELAQVTRNAAHIANSSGYGTNLKLIPFFGVDPRSYPNGVAAQAAVAQARQEGFCGIKIYPPMGYLPDDPRLADVFDYCLREGMPVMTHCGRGGAGRKGPVNFSDLAHPYNWVPVLENLIANRGSPPAPEKFRLCLAHFDCLRYRDEVAWWDEITKLIERYHNNPVVKVYVDVSANHPKGHCVASKYFRRLKEAFDNQEVRGSLLFGSDWWMQLHSFEETEYLKTYFDDYQHKSYYPGSNQAGGSAALKQVFEDNAREYLGKWY